MYIYIYIYICMSYMYEFAFALYYWYQYSDCRINKYLCCTKVSIKTNLDSKLSPMPKIQATSTLFDMPYNTSKQTSCLPLLVVEHQAVSEPRFKRHTRSGVGV